MSDSLFKPYSPQAIKKPQLYKVLANQGLYVLAFALGMAIIDVRLALAVVTAEVIFALPQSYLIFKAFAYYGSGNFEKIKTGLYVGEFYKVVLSCALFVTVFILAPNLHFPTLFTSYLVIHLSFTWLIQFQFNHPQVG